ncbi:MAG: hypothetical protein AAGC88_15810, partial [Bacteroidota bacterium]
MRLLTIFSFVYTLVFHGFSQRIKQNPDFLNQGHDWADSVLAIMSTDQKIGQLIMVDAYSADTSINQQEVLDWIADYHVGGVIFF